MRGGGGAQLRARAAPPCAPRPPTFAAWAPRPDAREWINKATVNSSKPTFCVEFAHFWNLNGTAHGARAGAVINYHTNARRFITRAHLPPTYDGFLASLESRPLGTDPNGLLAPRAGPTLHFTPYSSALRDTLVLGCHVARRPGIQNTFAGDWLGANGCMWAAADVAQLWWW
jgi:hypothetical protein